VYEFNGLVVQWFSEPLNHRI